MQPKKRILVVNEPSFTGTGYGVYGHELLTGLYSTGKYELCEFASFCNAVENAPQISNIPWGFIPNGPIPGDEKDQKEYYSDSANKWGAWKFEDVCLFFQPDVVISFRDWWMDEYINRSPFRRHYYYFNMPPVDSLPQDPLWLSGYLKCDKLFTYTEWAKKALERQTAGKAVVSGVLPPGANEAIFKPVVDKVAHKDAMGIDPSTIVIGTVMRNQSRKLYQDLFFSFAKIIETLPKETAKNVCLLCHVGYPDLHHDIPKLVRDSGIGSKIIFSYFCKSCGHMFLSYFRDATTYCNKCKKITASLPKPGNDVTRENMAAILNCMDIYVQYSTNEGFGMPLVEAAYCNVPVCAVRGSATNSILDKIGTISINPCRFFQDTGVSPYRALPDNVQFVKEICKFITSEKFKEPVDHLGKIAREEFSYSKSIQGWIDAIDSVNVKNTWASPPIYKGINAEAPLHLPNYEFVEWCVTNILQDPSMLNEYMIYRALKGLNYGVRMDARMDRGMNTENIPIRNRVTYSKQDVLQEFVIMAEKNNVWEEKRWNALGAKK